MHIVIIGAGQVGSFIARNLCIEHDIIVIERDKETAEKLRESHDVIVMEGNGEDISVLKEAQIEKADILLAVSGDDRTNIMASFYSASLGIQKIIVRVRNPNYLGYPKLLKDTNISVVHPWAIMSEKITSLIGSPFAWKTETLAMGKIKMFKLKVEDNAPIVGKTLANLGPPKSWIFVAVSKDGNITIPTGETKLESGDYVFALGVPDILNKLKELFDVHEEEIKSAVVVGGGRLGRGAAKILSKNNISTKLIESNPERARKAAEDLDHVLVFKGDATDAETLKEAGIESADYFIALTGDDENNVLSALLARNLGAKRTTLIYTKPDYIDVIEAIGVDRAISVRLSVANEILSLLHIHGVAHVALVEEGRAEVLEFDIKSETKILGTPLKDVHFPSGSIVGIVLRGEEVIIPRGDYVAALGDRVIIFTLPEAVKKVEMILGQ
ncbi:MAG: Trk system potassium transport protein TrkA [Thermodesulfobacteriota bacterium]|nr:MAG: Trk system potassium transport protein TrkA [Thermodesulfobacteriota bacterium]